MQTARENEPAKEAKEEFEADSLRAEGETKAAPFKEWQKLPQFWAPSTTTSRHPDDFRDWGINE